MNRIPGVTRWLPHSGRPAVETSAIEHEVSLGALLRQLRWAAGLSQRGLGSQALLSGPAISQIECAVRRTRRSTLARIASALSAVSPALGTAAELEQKLVQAAGQSLAPESVYFEELARRRLRRYGSRG